MPPFRKRFVYIIDDDDAVRESTAALLTSAGLNTRDYASGRAFLAEFDPKAGGCVLLDLHMPDISGFKMLDLLRALGNSAPIVLFSGRTDPMTDAFAKSSGAAAILAKPVAHDELIDLIRRLLSEGREE